MIDFTKCVVYKICCKDPEIDDTYIGSTCDFKRRTWEHKNYTNNYKRPEHHFPLYKKIREKGGWDNWYVRILEEFTDCENVYQKRICERKWIELLKPSLNCRIPGRSKAEWKKDNPDKCKLYTKRSREKKQKQQKRAILLEKVKKEEQRIKMMYLFGKNYIEII